MFGKIAAYWHKGGLEIYSIGKEGLVKLASGSLDALPKVGLALEKKVLIVGRELLLHTRKKYPPAPAKELYKAVALEIKEIFPLSLPAFFCRVFQYTKTHALVDIWAWESGLYPQIRSVFNFGYVVPEDLAFFFSLPQVVICRQGGVTYMLAYGDRGFLAGASYPDFAFDQKLAERFLHSLEQYQVQINVVTVYGDIGFTLKLKDHVQVSYKADSTYPPCLEGVPSLDLSPFQVERAFNLKDKGGFFFRIAVYLLLGYGLMQYLTLNNYDRAITKLQQQLAAMDKTTISVDAPQQNSIENYEEVVREVEQKMNATSSPLRAMDLLARRLPEGAFINRMIVSENKMDITVYSRDPLSTLKALGKAPEVKKLSLKGPVIRSRDTHLSSLELELELAR